MAGNKKPRKKYTPPKLKVHRPIIFRHSESDDARLKLVPQAAFFRMKDNQGTDEDYADVVVRINYGLELSRQKYPEILADMEKALSTLLALRKARNEVGYWRELTAEEKADIQLGMDYTDEMQANVSRRVFREAMRITLVEGKNV